MVNWSDDTWSGHRYLSGYRSRPFAERNARFGCEPQAPPGEERSITSHVLSAESLVLFSTEFATRAQIDRYCRKYEIRPKVQMEANALGAVIEIVRRTNLSTLLPAKIALAHDDLVAITLEPERLQRKAVLMRRKEAFLSAAVRAFIELAKEVASGLSVS
ncbi:LysR substrate-binding domain-containing protein [Pseudomonas pudica]|uniref:LysR substrate-binding domain-containing protein n=1 Tax=Pseudomonas pudica TaxID=272772 RepID=UPI002E1B0A19